MWDRITIFLSFTGIGDKTVWQDVIITAALLPVVLFLCKKFFEWWNKVRPSKIVFKNYISENSNIYIFHSQMSCADDNYNLKNNPKFITLYPRPLPTNSNNLGQLNKKNIDLVCSIANCESVADIFNILGIIKKTKNIHIGDLIKDWNVWSSPIFSVGFNPKTFKLIEKCNPIFFEQTNGILKIKNTDITFNSNLPNDAGIIQKTFNKESKYPVFIIAGLGTLGTSSATYILKNNFIKLGKLYGNNPFCVFLSVKTDEGKDSALIQKIIPKPEWFRIILHPMLYLSFKEKSYFDY